MKIGITGEQGFIGYHLTQFIKYKTDHDIVSLGRRFQSSPDDLRRCDWIIHLAGVNRSESVYSDNIKINKDLIDIIEQSNRFPNLIFVSSTQEGNGTEYGKSKSDSYEMIEKFYMKSKSQLHKVVLPNIFGPFCKPNYNSFVSTFCYNLNNDKEVQVIQDREVDLLYVQDACKMIFSIIDPSISRTFSTKEFFVSEILTKLVSFKNEYVDTNTLPHFENQFELDLFHTFRSFSNPVRKLIRRTDERGYLLECLRSKSNNSHFFYSITKPEITRGNHFHFNKIERFIIIKGVAQVKFNKLDSNEVETFIINSEDDSIIDIPVLKSHNLTNIGSEELICAFWTNEIFDEKNPDTYFKKID
jgi:UDP-2-acetamido-2,6-beta-L-arabino-hexul-4-ose reductase